MSREVFIADGYTESAYLAPVENVYEQEIRFTYRPTLNEERSLASDDVRSAKDGAQADRKAANRLVKQLVCWSITRPDKDGKQVPLELSVKNILRLKFKVFDRLQAIAIYGTEGGDVDPESSAGCKDSIDATLADSAIGDLNYADTKAEADEKN